MNEMLTSGESFDEFDIRDRAHGVPFVCLLTLLAMLFLRPWDYLPALAKTRPVTVMVLLIAVLFLMNRPRIRFFSYRPTSPLVALFAIMVVTLPFSYWPARSADMAMKYAQLIVIYLLFVNLAMSVYSAPAKWIRLYRCPCI